MEEVSAVLKEIGVGVRPIDDDFFTQSYEICKITRRMGITVDHEEELCHNIMSKFKCNVVGCKEQFQTLFDYEIHYNGCHRYVCQYCKKTLHTPRVLDIHIQETHDSFFEVMAEKQPMYQCYVTECDMKFMNSEERTSHCISVHKFPKKYRFDEHIKQKNKEKDNKESMETDQPEKEVTKNKNKKNAFANRPKHQKGFVKFAIKPSTNVDSEKQNTENIDSNAAVVSSKSALMFLPRQVQQKSFAKRLTKSDNDTEKNVLESDSIMDMADVLPNINK